MTARGAAQPSSTWSGYRVRKARAYMLPKLPAPCGRCGKKVQPVPARGWVVGHIKDRATHPELTLDPSNWQPEHRRCSDQGGQAAVIAKAKAQGAAEALAGAGSSHAGDPAEAPPLPSLSPGPGADLVALIDALPAPADTIAALPWCDGLLPVWEDASLPLAMSPPHPRAVGSYGPQAIEWAEEELGRRVIGGTRLRWWQRLAIIRQLEHDADGQLVWRQVVESASRRSGKSVRLRVVALWRIAHAHLVGEPQEIMLTSKDLKVAREIIRPAWTWAMGTARKSAGWDVLRGNGAEEVSSPDDDRWLVRASDSVYGYSPGCGMADEAWGIPPDAITEGLEPALLDRLWPQLILTSTAHVRATSLMRRRLLAATRGDDPSTLLLLWGARPGCDPGDEQVWRAASPYWSQARHAMMVSKYAAALAGEHDPEFDDPDPMRGFMAQFLNVWPMVAVKEAPGTPLVTTEDWTTLTAEREGKAPAGVAIESWPGGGVSTAAAWRREDGAVVVTASGHPDVAAAAAAARAWGARSVLVGASLASDPAFKGIRTESRTASLVACVADFSRLLAAGVVLHDGSEHLAEQVTSTRTKATPTGLRVTSATPADAIKAVVWAVERARTRKASGPARIILPTAGTDTAR